MRFRNLNKWDDPAGSAGLILVAQLLDEMLFDLSIDTYKPSVMTTGGLCAEGITTIDEVEAGNIRAPNIEHVRAELCANLEKDLVAKSLLPLPLAALGSVVKNPKAPHKELKCTLELLGVRLNSTNYRRKNEELLRRELLGQNRPAELRRLTRSYISTLLEMGFSQRHLYEMALDFFYYSANRIAGPEAIDEFFALFPFEAQQYAAIFRVNRVFENARKAVEPLRIRIADDISDEFDLSDFPAFAKANDQNIFAVSTTIRARDVYSAREIGERDLRLISTIQVLFHHKKAPGYLPDCIVVETSSGKMHRIGKGMNPMHRSLDLKEATARKQLERLVRDFSLEADSFSKFIRSIELHAMALDSNTEENQILNLWIAIESLVPSETRSGSAATIEHIVDSLIPFLNSKYLERLLRSAVRDFFKWDEPRIKHVFKSIPGRRHWEKLAKLLALPAHSAALASLESSFRDFHLIRDRVAYLRNILSSPALLKGALDAHKTRVEWQIRRIYRARNLIVHAGITPPYTHALIEHVHDYLDTVMSGLVRLASSPKTIESVAQGFKFVQLHYENYYKELGPKDLQFDSTNIDRLLFGRA